jgi:hypothetical protein
MGRAREGRKTHDAGEVAIELFYDGRKAPAGKIEQVPTPAHCRSIPTRGGVLLFACDVAFWLIVVPELQEDAKLVWVGEGEGEYFECAHGWSGME